MVQINIKMKISQILKGLYGVETKRINEVVTNNPDKFPSDFYFELTKEEEEILKSKFSTSSWGGRRKSIKVFTEQGVYMLATILKSKIATDVTVAIMRAFVKMRHFALNYEDIVNKLNDLDTKFANHDEVLQRVISALSDLIQDTKENETKKIGLISE